MSSPVKTAERVRPFLFLKFRFSWNMTAFYQMGARDKIVVVTLTDFEKLVNDAVSNLPDNFKKAIDNLNIVVEDWPKEDVAIGRLLLGLYQGIPKTTWGRHQGLQVPDKITIFRGPILFLANGDEDRVKQLVIDTVEHEIAHHFGIDDKRLREINR